MGGKSVEKESKLKVTIKNPSGGLDGQANEEDATGHKTEKLWTVSEQKRHIQKLAHLMPRIQESEKSLSGSIDDKGQYVDLSKSTLTFLECKILREIGDTPIPFTQLHYLYLNNNELNQLPSEIFHILPNLVWFDVRKNRLESIPETISGHQCLETFLLQENRILQLPLELGNVPNLKDLLVGGNPLEIPNRRLLQQCETNTNLIDYLRRCWEKQSWAVPTVRPHTPIEEKTRRLAEKRVKKKKIRDLSEIVCEKKHSSKILDQVVADKITNELRSQERMLQRAKDRETLKKWRDKRGYRNPEWKISKLVQPPPYGIDKEAKMPTRRELALHSIKKPKAKRKQKQGIDVVQEMEELRKSLQKMALKRQTDDPGREMTTRLNEIKAIKEIQKKIDTLKRMA